MNRGDLVRVWTLESLLHPEKDSIYFDPTETDIFQHVPRIGIVVKYEKWEKIVTVLFQDSGQMQRVPARDVEIIKRSPENVKFLKELYKRKLEEIGLPDTDEKDEENT